MMENDAVELCKRRFEDGSPRHPAANTEQLQPSACVNRSHPLACIANRIVDSVSKSPGVSEILSNVSLLLRELF
jgi:hypothetical protein